MVVRDHLISPNSQKACRRTMAFVGYNLLIRFTASGMLPFLLLEDYRKLEARFIRCTVHNQNI